MLYLEEKLFLRKLQVIFEQQSRPELKSMAKDFDGAVKTYQLLASEVLRLAFMQKKLEELIEEMDLFLNYFHHTHWENGINPDEDHYGVKLFYELRKLAYHYQDEVLTIKEWLPDIFGLFLIEAPDQIREQCHLPIVKDENELNILLNTEVIDNICILVNENHPSLITTIEGDSYLLGENISDNLKAIKSGKGF